MHTVTDINDSRIRQPLDTAPVILKPGSGRHLRDLELLIIPGKLDRNLTEHIEDSCLVHPFRILTHILLIIRQKLPLDRQRSLKAVLYDILSDHRRHPAQNTIIQKQTAVDGHLRLVKRLFLPHMVQKFVCNTLLITLRPQKFLKIKGMHDIIRLIPHAVTLYPSIMDTQHGTAAYNIKSSVLCKKFECRGNLRKLLQLIKKEQRFPLDEFLRRIHA